MDPSNGLRPSSNKGADKSVVFEAIQNIGSLEADVNSTGAITPSDEKTADPVFDARLAAKRRNRFIRFSAIAAVIVLGVAFMLIKGMMHSRQDLASARTDASQRFNDTSVPLAKITGGGSLSLQNNQTLSVNGQLNVNNSLVIAPTKQPDGAVTGQLYYDQTTNQLSFFNGKQFVQVVSGKLPSPSPSVTVNGTSGALSTGSGISLASNQLTNTGVLTLQGESGNVTLTAGNGILVNGTTLSNSGLLSLGGQHGDIAVDTNGLSTAGGTLKNTGVTSVGGQSGALTVGQGLSASGGTLKNSGIISAVGAGTITVTNDGNGNIVIDGPNGGSGGTVASPGGTIGKIAKFTGVQTIADSLLSDDGTTVTVGGALHVTGGITFDTPLAVTNGGTGANSAAGARANLGAAARGANNDITSLSGLTTALTVAQGGTGIGTLATNGVLIGNGASPLSSVVAGGSGLCLVSTAGAPSWQTCPGSGGVTSVDGLTGVLTLANSSGSAGTITINDASAASKGIASFNATNFLVNSGAVNTVQDIAVTSTPTFAGLTLSSPLAVTSGGTGKSSLAANGVLVGNGSSAVTSATGSTGQCLVISASGSPSFATCPGSGGVTSVNSATGAITIQGTAGSSVSTVGGTITINDASSSVKGLASFNSTNFTVAGGAVNTAQDITTTSAPTFGQLSIVSNQATGKMLTINNTNAATTGNLLDLQLNGSSKLSVAPNGNLITAGTISAGAINGQTIGNAASFTGSLAVAGALSVNTITPTSALTVGVSGQSFTLQGNASSTLTATNGANTTTLSFQAPTASVNYRFAAASAGNYDICTTSGNCAGVGGGVTTPGGTANTLAKFTSSGTIGNSIITDNGSTVTIGGTLSVNNITPSNPLTVGATTQNLTLQGAGVTVSATSGSSTNALVFAAPSGSNKTITLPNASGTVAVSASGPLSLDVNGNLSCPTCLTSGGSGGTSGVASLNGLTGAVVLQGTDSQTFSSVGSTISVHDATSAIKGVASFNSANLTVTSGNVNTVQDIAVTSTPTFAGLNLTSALTVGNGGTGASTAAGARSNLGAAASGANSDITSLSGLTTALSVVQGGTGIATTPTNGQILIGNGTGYSLNTLTAGSGVTITNTAGNITIASPGSGTCASCANASLSNLSGVAINTSLLPGVAGGANLGSAALPFGQLFLAGTSASPAANNFKITGAATASRTITLPDASGTVAVSASGYLNLSANGNLTFVGPLAVTDGGTGANNAAGARSNLGAAASGANSDITSLSGLTTALSVVQGGTGLTTLTANQLLVASSSSTISQVSNGNAGYCLVSNGAGSVPTFQNCPGAGGVTALDGLSGSLSINNTTGSGSSITINNAQSDGATKGIAAFNSTNFTASNGVVNTVQNIDTSAQPTFADLTATKTITADNFQNNSGFSVQGNGATYVTGLTISSNGSSALLFKNTGNSELARISVPSITDLFFGNSAGASFTGSNNSDVGIGYNSLNAVTSGFANTTVGSDGLSRVTTGSNNTSFGSSSLGANVSGNYNTSTGAYSQGSTTGSYNTSYGANTLLTNTTGTNNTALGYHADVGANNLQNATAIGTNSYVTQSNSLVLGCISGTNGCGTTTNVGIGTTAPLALFSVGSSSQFKIDISGNASTSGTISGTTLYQNGHQVCDTSGNCSGSGGVTTIGALDGGTANANGATISGATLYLQSASGTYAGLVNTGAQTFAGNKTFSGNVVVGTGATFTANGSGFDTNGNLGIGTLNPGANIDVQSAGTSGNTSGTVNNIQLNLQGTASAAATGGTLNNYGAKITLGSGSGSGTTSNYGLYISGNGGSGGTGLTTNYAIYSASTAASLLSGSLQAAAFNSTGNVTIGTSAGSGAIFMNNGTTINSTLALGNFTFGGSIGTAAATVDKYTSISVAQTTGGGQTLSIPNPTSSAVYGRVLYLSNVGTADFTLVGTPINKLGQTLKAGSSITLVWSNTNGGASWIYAGNGSGNFVSLQGGTPGTADHGNLNIDGTGVFGSAVSTLQLTATGQTVLGGASNQAQLVVKANASQSTNNPLITLQASNGSELARITADGSANVGFGARVFASAGLTGTDNVAFGSGALLSNTSGSSNVAINDALQNNSSGNNNIGIGQYALNGNSSGSYNIGIGGSALLNITTGSSSNVAVGSGGLLSMTSGSGNAVLGYGAGYALGTSNENTFIGDSAGYRDYNTSFVTVNGIQYSTAIGAYAQVQASNSIVLGSVDHATKVGIGTTIPTNTFSVSPLDYTNQGSGFSASQASGSGTITLTGAGFNANMVGEAVIWADGQTETVTGYTDSSHITGSSTTITETGQVLRIQHVGFQVTSSGTAYLQQTSTTAFSIQNNAGVSLFNADTSGSTITIGNTTSGNYITLSASGGITAYGTAQHTKTIGLNAEYAGAVLDAQSDASCSSASNGTMTSGYDDPNDMSYYQWVGTAAAQCYDVVVRVTLPSDFGSWSSSTPLTLQTYTTNTSVGSLNIALKDTAHAYVSGCSYVNATPATNNTWTTSGSTCNFAGGTYTPGQVITLRIRMSADTTSNVRIGDLSLSYNSKF